MKKEISYGVIPFREGKVLLVKHGKGHWGFPKGHAEKDEDPKASAARELEEETGLKIKKFLPFEPFTEHYFFTFQGEKVDKMVIYYLAEVEGELSLQKEEISDGGWFTFEKAIERATFPETKKLCEKAKLLFLVK